MVEFIGGCSDISDELEDCSYEDEPRLEEIVEELVEEGAEKQEPPAGEEEYRIEASYEPEYSCESDDSVSKERGYSDPVEFIHEEDERLEEWWSDPVLRQLVEQGWY